MAAERKSQVGGGGRVREDPHLQLQGEPGQRPPHRAHALPAAGRAGRRPRRRRGAADRRRAGPPARRRLVSERRPRSRWRALWVETTERLGRLGRRGAVAVPGGLGPRRRLSWLQGSTSRATERGGRPARRHGGAPAGRRAAAVRARALGFRRLDLLVDRRVLIPRPETEQVVEVALALLRWPARAPLVDRRPRHRVGSDRACRSPPSSRWPAWRSGRPTPSPDALDVARANLAGIGRAGANVRVVEGDWFDALPADLRGRLDLVVSNPPYVAEHDELPPEVRRLGAGHGAARRPRRPRRAPRASSPRRRWLAPGGWLVTEIGADAGRSGRRAGPRGRPGRRRGAPRPGRPRPRSLLARRPLGDFAPLLTSRTRPSLDRSPRPLSGVRCRGGGLGAGRPAGPGGGSRRRPPAASCG